MVARIIQNKNRIYIRSDSGFCLNFTPDFGYLNLVMAIDKSSTKDWKLLLFLHMVDRFAWDAICILSNEGVSESFPLSEASLSSLILGSFTSLWGRGSLASIPRISLAVSWSDNNQASRLRSGIPMTARSSQLSSNLPIHSRIKLFFLLKPCLSASEKYRPISNLPLMKRAVRSFMTFSLMGPLTGFERELSIKASIPCFLINLLTMMLRDERSLEPSLRMPILNLA